MITTIAEMKDVNTLSIDTITMIMRNSFFIIWLYIMSFDTLLLKFDVKMVC
mgnify:CR=1 FL=1